MFCAEENTAIVLTLFAVCKPFTDAHIRTIQCNAIQSWLRIAPTPQILLFGDREGVAETAAEFGVTYVPGVKRGNTGRDLMSDAIRQATELANGDVLMYTNADMIYPPTLDSTVRAVDCERYLMVGERWDAPILDAVDFSAGWWKRIEAFARRTGGSPGACSMDYFIFPKGMYADLPDMAAGAWYTDNVILSRALEARIPVIDATPVVFAIHQQHYHNYYPGGLPGIAHGVESMQAKALLPDGNAYNLAHATVRLLPG